MRKRRSCRKSEKVATVKEEKVRKKENWRKTEYINTEEKEKEKS